MFAARDACKGVPAPLVCQGCTDTDRDYRKCDLVECFAACNDIYGDLGFRRQCYEGCNTMHTLSINHRLAAAEEAWFVLLFEQTGVPVQSVFIDDGTCDAPNYCAFGNAWVR